MYVIHQSYNYFIWISDWHHYLHCNICVLKSSRNSMLANVSFYYNSALICQFTYSHINSILRQGDCIAFEFIWPVHCWSNIDSNRMHVRTFVFLRGFSMKLKEVPLPTSDLNCLYSFSKFQGKLSFLRISYKVN